MKRNYLILLISFCLIFTFISCDISLADINAQYGFDIYFDNYYDWCMALDKNDLVTETEPNGEKIIIDKKEDFKFYGAFDRHTSFHYTKLMGSGLVNASTEWKDWQSEEGKLLRPYIGSNKISNDFQGKFKIKIFDDRFIFIYFNDNNNTVIKFQTFYGDWQYDVENNKYTYDKSLWEKEEKDNELSYSCWLRELDDSGESYISRCSVSNKARITIKKLDNTDTENVFGYTLSIQGKNIIDCKMYNYKHNSSVSRELCLKSKLNILNSYSWAFFDSSIKQGIEREDARLFLQCYLTFPTSVRLFYGFVFRSKYAIHPSYGMSIKEIDEDNKTISINILDVDNCAFADYFTYIYNEDINKRVINYYKLKDGVPQLVKTIKGDIRTNAENYPDLYK